MNTNQFHLLATLSIFGGKMSAGDMLDYLDGEAMTQEERTAAKQDLATLIGTGLIGIESTNNDPKAAQLWLTERGIEVVDIAATIRMERILQDWQSAVPS